MKMFHLRKKVGIIGIGSTAVQAIPIIAETADELFVFQRTPNFGAPRNNGPLDPEYENRVKAMYPEWREMQKTPSADMYLLIFSQCFRTQMLAQICLMSRS